MNNIIIINNIVQILFSISPGYTQSLSVSIKTETS